MIKIGISAAFSYPDGHRTVFAPKVLSYIENDMAKYVTRPGIIPVLLPSVEESILDQLVAEMDGFVFQGGTDIAPKFYDETPIENGRWPGDPIRDEYELRLFNKAFHSGKPILAVCRGMQLMNVFFGGSLHQDTKTQKPQSIIHRDGEIYDRILHSISFTPGKILDELYQNDPARMVNSVHHQSVKQLGADLEVLAISPEDGVIEAIGYTGAEPGKILGVQWHPEFSYMLGSTVISADILFNHFISQIKNQKS